MYPIILICLIIFSGKFVKKTILTNMPVSYVNVI